MPTLLEYPRIAHYFILLYIILQWNSRSERAFFHLASCVCECVCVCVSWHGCVCVTFMVVAVDWYWSVKLLFEYNSHLALWWCEGVVRGHWSVPTHRPITVTFSFCVINNLTSLCSPNWEISKEYVYKALRAKSRRCRIFGEKIWWNWH